MNPWAVVAILVLVGGSIAGAGWKGYELGRDSLIAEQAKVDQARRDTREAALTATAEALAKLEVKQITIRQQVERETIERPVYRDCQHTDDGLRLVNEAITGISQPAGDRELSGDPAAN